MLCEIKRGDVFGVSEQPKIFKIFICLLVTLGYTFWVIKMGYLQKKNIGSRLTQPLGKNIGSFLTQPLGKKKILGHFLTQPLGKQDWVIFNPTTG